MPSQSLRDGLGHVADDRRVRPSSARNLIAAGPYLEHDHAVVHGTRAPRARLKSQAGHPSSVRDPKARTACSRCGPISMTVTEAPDAVRRLVDLADQLLCRDLDQPLIEVNSPPQRVARLRDELHITANRIVSFGDDEHPLLDPVRITVPLAGSSALAPAHVRFQLHVSAGRLLDHLDALSADDWTRIGWMGDRPVSLGELVP